METKDDFRDDRRHFRDDKDLVMFRRGSAG